MRLRALGNVLDAAFGGHDVTMVDDGEAPEADRELVQDPLAAGQGFVTLCCARSDCVNFYKGDFSLVVTTMEWLIPVWSILQSGQFTLRNAATALL